MITIELSNKSKWKICGNKNTLKLLDKIHRLDLILIIDFYHYFYFLLVFQINKIIY